MRLTQQSTVPGSNRREPVWKTGTLPFCQQCMVQEEGIEPSRSYPSGFESDAATITPLLHIVLETGVEPARSYP